jgi:hypothetical protein
MHNGDEEGRNAFGTNTIISAFLASRALFQLMIVVMSSTRLMRAVRCLVSMDHVGDPRPREISIPFTNALLLQVPLHRILFRKRLRLLRTRKRRALRAANAVSDLDGLAR